MVFNATLNNISVISLAVSFIGGNRNTRKKTIVLPLGSDKPSVVILTPYCADNAE